LYPSSSSFIRKADRPQVSTFSLTATIIVDKSFLRIQVIAYISTTDHRNRSVPIFALSFLSLSLFLSSSRSFEGRVFCENRNRSVPIFALSFLLLSLFLSSSRPFEGRVHALGRWTMDGSSEREPMWDDRRGCWLLVMRKSGTDLRNRSVPIFALSFLLLSLFLSSSRSLQGRWTAFLSENHSGMIGEVVGCSLLVVGNAKIGYRPKEPVSPHFRSLFSLLFSPFRWFISLEVKLNTGRLPLRKGVLFPREMTCSLV